MQAGLVQAGLWSFAMQNLQAVPERLTRVRFTVHAETFLDEGVALVRLEAARLRLVPLIEGLK